MLLFFGLLKKNAITDAEGTLVRSYEGWRTFVGSSALVLQGYLAPSIDYLLKPGSGIIPAPAGGTTQSVWFGLFLSVLAYVISAGLVYSFYIQGLMWLYRQQLWFRFNKRFAIFGHWDLRFLFEKNEGLSHPTEPTGYIFVEQDYLGCAKVSGFYDYNLERECYLSEFVMSGVPILEGDRVSFRFFYRTTHYGNTQYTTDADTVEGIEIVSVSTTSKTNDFPTRLVGFFAIYRRAADKPLWRGQTRYTRNDDLSIRHEIKMR